jgi:hypothetical protein
VGEGVGEGEGEKVKIPYTGAEISSKINMVCSSVIWRQQGARRWLIREPLSSLPLLCLSTG